MMGLRLKTVGIRTFEMSVTAELGPSNSTQQVGKTKSKLKLMMELGHPSKSKVEFGA